MNQNFRLDCVPRSLKHKHYTLLYYYSQRQKLWSHKCGVLEHWGTICGWFLFALNRWETDRPKVNEKIHMRSYSVMIKQPKKFMNAINVACRPSHHIAQHSILIIFLRFRVFTVTAYYFHQVSNNWSTDRRVRVSQLTPNSIFVFNIIILIIVCRFFRISFISLNSRAGTVMHNILISDQRMSISK